jgi:hypothetical protein
MKTSITQIDQLPLVLCKADWAKLLNCSPRTIDRMDRAGELPTPLIAEGHRRRWSREAAAGWLSGAVGWRGRR